MPGIDKKCKSTKKILKKLGILEEKKFELKKKEMKQGNYNKFINNLEKIYGKKLFSEKV